MLLLGGGKEGRLLSDDAEGTTGLTGSFCTDCAYYRWQAADKVADSFGGRSLDNRGAFTGTADSQTDRFKRRQLQDDPSGGRMACQQVS